MGRVRAAAAGIALDTNVVVRFLTRDDPAQALRARALIETGVAFVPRTVVLEAEWVLRTIYRLERGTITAGLIRLLGLPGVEIEDRPTVARALEWCGQGLDFADALHLASSSRAEAFATEPRRSSPPEGRSPYSRMVLGSQVASSGTTMSSSRKATMRQRDGQFVQHTRS